MPMDFETLRDEIVHDGLASVEKWETDPNKKRGCIIGFRLLKRCANYAAVIELWAERTRKDSEFVMHQPHTPENIQKYWKMRCATAQLEWAKNILEVDHGFPVISALAGYAYARMVLRRA
jgi:hypothetical protein